MELNGKFDKLDLSWNEISDEAVVALSRCISNLERIYLYHCFLTTSGMKTLFNEIKALEEPIKEVNIDCNKITDQSAADLSNCLHNINKLYMSDSSLTMLGIKIIIDAISEQNIEMETLVMTYKSSVLSDESVKKYLKQIRSKVKVVRICELEQDSIWTSDESEYSD